MSMKSFRLGHFPYIVKATKTKDKTELSLEFEKESVPKDAHSRIFLSIDSEGPLFWNHSTGTYGRGRARPNPVIGKWNFGRLAQVCFLERLFNVEATHFTVANYLSVFQDESWAPIFDYVGLDSRHTFD